MKGYPETLTLAKGLSGAGASFWSVWLSLMPEIEVYLRIVSLLTGIAVGIVTFISIYRRIDKK